MFFNQPKTSKSSFICTTSRRMDNKRKMIILSLFLAGSNYFLIFLQSLNMNSLSVNCFFFTDVVSSVGICCLVLCEDWTASVVHNLEALVSSCAVVPCSFSHPRGTLPSSRLRGIWHHKNDRNQIIYHDDNTKILDSFKERTKLLGHLGQMNCTLEIMPIKSHDNGPFCFRIELVKTDDNKPTADKFSFVEDCVGITMLCMSLHLQDFIICMSVKSIRSLNHIYICPFIDEPPKPTLGPFKVATPEKPFTITCSVRHTCPSRMPKLTWSKGATEEITEIHKDLSAGIWETQSILTFIPQEKDDDTELTCSALFSGGAQSHTSLTLNVKRTYSLF